mgnify:CR=1 FL=1
MNANKDRVEYNGKEVKREEEKVYILLNKPIGYVTTAKDQFSRDTVLDLVKVKQRVVPVRKTRHVHIWRTFINKRWRICV